MLDSGTQTFGRCKNAGTSSGGGLRVGWDGDVQQTPLDEWEVTEGPHLDCCGHHLGRRRTRRGRGARRASPWVRELLSGPRRRVPPQRPGLSPVLPLPSRPQLHQAPGFGSRARGPVPARQRARRPACQPTPPVSSDNLVFFLAVQALDGGKQRGHAWHPRRAEDAQEPRDPAAARHEQVPTAPGGDGRGCTCRTLLRVVWLREG